MQISAVFGSFLDAIQHQGNHSSLKKTSQTTRKKNDRTISMVYPSENALEYVSGYPPERVVFPLPL